MPLTAGTRLGPYEIVGALGAGGMGEVYRATDTKLKRQVAVKILPPALAADPDRLARFQREAEVLAALNHPNIASIYGLEDADPSAGSGQVAFKALVMELVEGLTLEERLRADGSGLTADDPRPTAHDSGRSRPSVMSLKPGGGLPVAEALGIARQIVDALEAAHEQGIIHRDLKPANVKVRPDGTVKVLDFGLAKLTQAPGSGLHAPDGPSQSPTITTPAMTGMGMILGTAAYMSPEQARGRTVDRRTDIWAFGVVLYEMLTGRRAFEGEDVSLTLAAVMKSEPDLGALPSDVPAAVRSCLGRCLHKDPRQRLRDIGDVRLVLEGAFETAPVSTSAVAPPAPRPLWRRVLPAAAAAVLAGVFVGLIVWSARSPEPRLVTRFEHIPPGELQLISSVRSLIAASPDGRRLVYAGVGGLYLHSMEEVEDRLLVAGATTFSNLFFSPDGQSVGYFQGGQLRRLAVSGGAPQLIMQAFNVNGVTWAADDTIFFAKTEGISRVPARGGPSELVIPAKDGEQLYAPQLLPDADTLMFSVTEAGSLSAPGAPQNNARVVAQSLRSGERSVLLPTGSDARYIPTGHLVYVVDDGLFAARFDPETLEVAGGAVSLLPGIRRSSGVGPPGTANYDVSLDGTLFYVAGGTGASASPLVWVNRDGKAEPIASITPNRFSTPRLSSDGQRVLVVAQSNVRIYDLASGRETRVTSEGTVGPYADWVPGEQAVTYSSTRSGRGGPMNIWMQPLDGSGNATQVTVLNGQVHVDSWTPDGRMLAAHHHSLTANASVDVLLFPSGADSSPQPFHTGPARQADVVFSPDGRYAAYVDSLSGQPEVFIRPFPGPGPQTPVSVGGGREPAWARNGELFYRRPGDDAMMVVAVVTSPQLSVGPLRELFRGSGNPGGSSRATYAVTADGQRFLMSADRVASGQSRIADVRPRINIVMNWVEELKRRVPAN